jgi:glyoxylase-like metal-dependent hydrolase (beta-lactamase superfamily II)
MTIHPTSTQLISRRSFLTGAAGLATAALMPRYVLAATAAHTFKHGDFEITVVSDGLLLGPGGVFAPDTPAAEREAAIKAAGQTLEQFKGETNLTLARSGNDLILFDTGGGGFQPTVGKISESLTAAGIDPSTISKVVFTHGHPDHIWGTVLPDGQLRFPKATYYSGAAEWDFWNGKDILSQLPKEMHQMATESQRHYAAVKDRVTMVKPGEEIVTGIGVLDTPGHTPGHLSFEVAGDEGLIVVADVLISASIYFPHPEWKFGFDANHDVAISSRKKLLDRAATDKVKLLGYHWAYPGIGYAERSGTAYKYVKAA